MQLTGKRAKRLFALILGGFLLCTALFAQAYASGSSEPAIIKDSGTYTYSGEVPAIVVEEGCAPVVILNGANINNPSLPAITVKPGATLYLKIEGENVLKGGQGCAAICVEPAYDAQWNYLPGSSAKLIISGEGVLNAAGGQGDLLNGRFGGGAGIGGSGQNYDARQGGVDFGKIEIEESFSGVINAVGGAGSEYIDDGSAYGGGAGIGGGGCNAGDNFWGVVFGEILICGGTVKAGSEGDGAGIGGGGAAVYGTIESRVSVLISDGTVTADGGLCAAGIGGGALCDGGIIRITGGIVTAAAGGADGSMGGAGIGGGNDASVLEITITGGEVAARASGGAAGIGGGTNTSYGFHYGDMNGSRTEGKVGSISISGRDALVKAWGGTAQGYSGIYGGAGIGSGYPVGNNNRSVAFDISITDGAEVEAYGGEHAQAIGYGYRPEDFTGYGIRLELDDTVRLWAQNADCYQPALVMPTPYEPNPVVYLSEDTPLIAYEHFSRESETVDPSEAAKGYLTYGDAQTVETFDWDYSAGRVYIDGSEFRTAENLNGNWAAVYSPKKFTVSYELNGGSGAEGADYSPQAAEPGGSVAAAAAPVKEGYVFAGWESGGKIYQPGDAVAVEGDIVLNALWQSAPDYISITVEKRWKLDDGGTAAGQITAVLMRGGEEYARAVLNQENGWRHEWSNLEQGDWSVRELNVPDGFTVEIERQGGGFIIINDDIPKEIIPDSGEGADVLLWIFPLILGCALTCALVRHKKCRERR